MRSLCMMRTAAVAEATTEGGREAEDGSFDTGDELGKGEVRVMSLETPLALLLQNIALML